jgi:hypothetical protein
MVGLAWRRTSPRKADFIALGQLVTEALGIADSPRQRGNATAQTSTSPVNARLSSMQ